MNDKGKVFLLDKEGVGTGDETLGFEILITMIDTLSQRQDYPVAIIFWNTAVRLLAEGSPLSARLKILEEKGVEILAGKLCVIDLGLEDELAVGKPVSMNEILDLLLHHEVISL